MRSALLIPLALAPVCLAKVNVTRTEKVDLDTGVGELGWGAEELAFGYSAGAGLNFSTDFVGGGFNAGVPEQSEGAFGGGWTLTNTTVEFGLGGVFNNQSFSVAVSGDKSTGTLVVTVNGKAIAL